MTTKKNLTKNSPRDTKNNDAVVYKVMIALVAVCIILLALRSLRDYYATMEGFARLYDWTPKIALIGLAIMAVSGGLMIALRKNRTVLLLCPWILVFGTLVAATGWNMHTSHIEDFSFLYYLTVAILVQYIIFQLYQWEFFLFSLSTVTAGGLFFSFSHGLYFTAKNIGFLVVLLIVLAGTAVCTWKAAQNRGCLMVGGKKLHLFSPKSAPLLICIVDVLWLICTVAVLFLGGLFAYYCMFAAIAVEFIAAVYYTFQLN